MDVTPGHPYRRVRTVIAAASQWAKQREEDVEPVCSAPGGAPSSSVRQAGIARGAS